MTRRHARAQPGRRALGRVPHGQWHQWHRLTLLGALARDGVAAIMSVARPTSARVFQAFVEQVLLPALRTRAHPVVVLDNLPPHKAAGVRQAFAAAGVEIRYLPPYSPDLNPIEPCWSKIKTLLRGQAARPLEALDHVPPEVIEAVSAQDARGWFAHAGYRSQ